MSDVIATIWDFDKTLISTYMQEPIFKHFRVEGKNFWLDNNQEIKDYERKGFTVNHDSFYLNRFIRMSQKGQPFDGLNNEMLKGFGKELTFYNGAIDLLAGISNLNNTERYKEFGIHFENYIISTGFKRIIEGSAAAAYVKKIWGAEIIDKECEDGKTRLFEVAYSLDNTSKTRALFEINKGVGIVEGSKIDVNTKIDKEQRRVQFCNMVFVADGPSDVPAFSIINQNKGSTLAVYPKGDATAFRQVDTLRRDGRVQMIAEADYTEGSSAYLWLFERLQEQANVIIDRVKARYSQNPGTPQHLV